ncbi:unnamed protein product, partial [Callosobruchus maculatus]
MLPFVGLEGIRRRKPGPAKLADMRPQLLVSHPVMVQQEMSSEERLSASLAFEVSYAGVSLCLVQEQIVFASEFCAAFFT